MKAHDSWPGNKPEEDRLPNRAHADAGNSGESGTNTQLHMKFNTTAVVVRQAYGP